MDSAGRAACGASLRCAAAVGLTVIVVLAAVATWPGAARAADEPSVFEVGDSLSVGMQPYLPGAAMAHGWAAVQIDAHISRGVRSRVPSDPHTGVSAVAALRAAHGEPAAWIVALGANDSGVPPSQHAALIREMLDAIGREHPVMWVNVYLPRYPQRQQWWNAALTQVAAERPDQLVVFDWASIAATRSGISAPDRVHLTTTGYRQMAEAVAGASRDLLLPGAARVPTQALVTLDPPRDDAGAGLVPLAPVRVLDTRSGAPVAAGESVVVHVGAAAPPGVSGAALNVTSTGAAAPGYLTVYPCTNARPETSAVNVGPGADASSLAIVGLDPNGDVCVFASVTTHVVVDLTGAFVPDGGVGFEPSPPARLADTRSNGPLAAGEVLTVDVPGGGDAALVNLTAVAPSTAGFVTAYPCGTAPPPTSNLNVTASRSAKANAALIALGPSGQLCVVASITTHVVVDLVGRFRAAASLRFHPIGPIRLLDTRSGRGGWSGRLARGQTIDVPAPVAGDGTVVATVTVIQAGADGYLTVWGGGDRPVVSSVNAVRGETIANVAVAAPGADGQLELFAGDGARQHLALDVTGVFT